MMERLKSCQWAAALVFILSIGAFGLFCILPRESSLKALPAHPLALVSVDVPALMADKEAMPDKIREEIVRRCADTGLDYSEKVYLFLTKEQYFGVLIPIADKDKLDALMADKQKKGECAAWEETDGIRLSLCDSVWMTGYNEEVMVALLRSDGADDEALRIEIRRCLSQDMEESGVQSSLFEEVSQGKETIRLGVSLHSLVSLFGDDDLTRMADEVNMSGANLLAEVKLGKHGIVANTRLKTGNPLVDWVMKSFVSSFNKLEGRLSRNVPEDALGWFCVNLDGETVLKWLRKDEGYRTKLLALNMMIDADQMLRSLKGDMALTLYSTKVCFKDVLFTGCLSSTEFLREADYWVESSKKSGAYEIRDYGRIRFGLLTEADTAYFGVTGESLYVTGNERWAEQAELVPTDALLPWKDDITSSCLLGWLNWARVKAAFIPASQVEKKCQYDFFDCFDDMVLRASAEDGFVLELYSRCDGHFLEKYFRKTDKRRE